MKRKSTRSNPEDTVELTNEPGVEDTAVAAEAEAGAETFAAAEATEEPAAAVTTMQAVEVAAADAPEVEVAPERSAASLLPALGESLGKAAYGTFYYASYGVVFSALVVARLVPMDNLMGRAIKAGAAAAKDAVEHQTDSAVAESAPADEALVTSS